MIVTAIVLQSLLALVFLMAGGTKIIGQKMHVDHFAEWGYPQWFRVVTGLVEVVGAAGLVVGLWVPEVAIAAGFWLAATMIGAVYADLLRTEKPPTGAIAPLVLMALAVPIGVLRVVEVVD